MRYGRKLGSTSWRTDRAGGVLSSVATEIVRCCAMSISPVCTDAAGRRAPSICGIGLVRGRPYQDCAQSGYASFCEGLNNLAHLRLRARQIADRTSIEHERLTVARVVLRISMPCDLLKQVFFRGRRIFVVGLRMSTPGNTSTPSPHRFGDECSVPGKKRPRTPPLHGGRRDRRNSRMHC